MEPRDLLAPIRKGSHGNSRHGDRSGVLIIVLRHLFYRPIVLAVPSDGRFRAHLSSISSIGLLSATQSRSAPRASSMRYLIPARQRRGPVPPDVGDRSQPAASDPDGRPGSSNHTTAQDGTCPSSPSEVTISVTALLKLSTWCQRRLDDQLGEVTCSSPTPSPPACSSTSGSGQEISTTCRADGAVGIAPSGESKASESDSGSSHRRHHLGVNEEVSDD